MPTEKIIIKVTMAYAKTSVVRLLSLYAENYKMIMSVVSSSVGPVANATDVLQPIGLLYSPYPHHSVWTFPRSPPGTPTSTTTREILVAKGET